MTTTVDLPIHQQLRQRLWRFLLGAVVVGWYTLVAITCVLTVAGFMGEGVAGRFAWPLDLASHFRLQYFVIQFAALVFTGGILVTGKTLRPVPVVALVLSCFFSGLNFTQLKPYLFPSERPVAVQDLAGTLRLLHINVLWKNYNTMDVAREIQRIRPDIISLQEYTPDWRNSLEATGVLEDYPHRVFVHGGDNALYSRIPYDKKEIFFLTPNRTSNLLVEFNLKGEPVNLLMTHITFPVHRDTLQRQRQHVDMLVRERPRYHDNLILVGDFNTTPWSKTFKRLTQGTGLWDTQRAVGLQPSWPTFQRLMMIPIDHCLVSDRFVVLRRETGRHVGSDHLPVMVELGLTKNNLQ